MLLFLGVLVVVIYLLLDHTSTIITLTALILTTTSHRTPSTPSSVYPKQAPPLAPPLED